MNFTSESPLTILDNRIAAGVLLVICLFGFFCNFFVIILVRSAPSMHNSFGILAFSQAIADCGHQAIFAFYVVPLLTMGLKILRDPFVMSRIGHALVICYQVCGYSHVCTSFNRFSSVYLPAWFGKAFSRRNTTILAIFIWTLAVVPTSLFLLIPYFDCYMLFDVDAWAWNYAPTAMCAWIAFNIHFPTYITIASTFSLLDICTLWRVYRYTKVGPALQTVPEMGGKARKRKLETIFFWQVCLQGVLYVTELITYFYLSTKTTDKWMRFFLTDVIWCICHAGDGFLIISLNRELREGLKAMLRCDIHNYLEPSYYFGADSQSPSMIPPHSVSSEQPRQIASSLVPLPSSEQTPTPSQDAQISTDHSQQPLVVSSDHSEVSVQPAGQPKPVEEVPEIATERSEFFVV